MDFERLADLQKRVADHLDAALYNTDYANAERLAQVLHALVIMGQEPSWIWRLPDKNTAPTKEEI